MSKRQKMLDAILRS